MTRAVRIIYAGTPDFALPPAQRLYEAGIQFAAVYTQPDRPAGRGRKLTAGPVKRWALEQGLPVEQPSTLRTPEAVEQLASYQPDLMIVTAYGLLLPPDVLAIPRLGCINLHASLLPRWRGAAPIQRAIQAGDAETGITLMQMDADLDTGAMLAARRLTIAEGETTGELQQRLAELAADVMIENLDPLLAGELTAEPQPDEQATYAYKIRKDEAWLDWRESAGRLARQVAAFNPWPIAQTRWHGQVLRIGLAAALDITLGKGVQPGEVIAAGHDGIDVACGEGVLRVTALQLPGARMLGCADFVNAHSVQGSLLGGIPAGVL